MEKTTLTGADLKGLIESTVAKSVEGFASQLEEVNKNLVKSAPELSKEKLASRQGALIAAEIEVLKEINEGKSLPAGGRAERVSEIIEKRYGKKDPAFVEEVQLAAKDLMVSGNGGALVIEEYAQGFLDQLWDATVIGQLGVKMLPSESGNLTINKIVQGVAAGYVDENGSIPTSTIKFGKIRLSFKKLMALVPMSNDLIRYASVNSEALVNDQIIKEMVRAADHAFLYGTGGEFQPTGIANVKDVQKVAGTPAPTFDLGLDMKAMLGRNNHEMASAQFVMGWDTYVALQKESTANNDHINLVEMSQGKFCGLPFVVTNRVKGDGKNEDLFLILADEVTGIQGMGVTIDQSRDASILTADGAINAFTHDFTITRAIVEHDFGLNYNTAAVIANVKLGK